MEQQQSKVSFSLGTKLLISLVLLLFISIGFLDVSTIILFGKDKRAYTYQTQSTESVMAGREFVNTIRPALDALRLALASIDPQKAVTAQQNAALKSVLDNQSQVLAVDLAWLNPVSGISRSLARTANADRVVKAGFREDDLVLTPESVKTGIQKIEAAGFAIFNVSKIGRPPVVAVVLADLKSKNASEGLPVAVGYLPTGGLSEIRSPNLTIVDRDGWVLFHSNPAEYHNKKNVADDPLFDAALANPLSAGAQEYEFDGRRYLGSYTKPGYDLIVLNRTDWRVAMRATFTLVEKFVLLGLMAVGAAIVFAILFSKTLTAPLNRLYQATKEVAAGNFDIHLTQKSRDEIGALTSSFNAMSAKINDLVSESMRKVQLENELAIASTVQQTLIPPPSFKNDLIHIESHYQAAATCGGDWWGFFGVAGKICIMISDATGHGLPSALITASARSCFSVMHKMAQEDPEFAFSPGAMLSFANRVVHDAANGKIMMTFFLGVLDLENRKLIYASAGHNPPWLLSRQGDAYKSKSLKATGPRLGEVRDVPPYEEKEVTLSVDDVLFLYTDGLLEGRNAVGEMFGKRKALELVQATLPQGLDAAVKKVIDDFLQHNGDKVLDDDVTVAAARIVSFGPGGLGGTA